MLTEYEVRSRIKAIRASKLSPVKKVRALLQVSRALSRQAKELGQTKDQIDRSNDRKALYAFQRLLAKTLVLSDDVRTAARELRATGQFSSMGAPT